jgi:hypothetical protein
MHIPQDSRRILVQNWVSGTHRDLGRDLQDGVGLGDIPLAGGLQQIRDAMPDFQFNEDALKDRFPAYAKDPLPAGADWIPDEAVLADIQPTNTGFMRLLGRSTRKPGRYYKDGFVTKECICPSVRLRGYGAAPGQSAIPGYRCVQDGMTWKWVEEKGLRAKTSDSGESFDPVSIPEAQYGAFMARLLGWPAPPAAATLARTSGEHFGPCGETVVGNGSAENGGVEDRIRAEE